MHMTRGTRNINCHEKSLTVPGNHFSGSVRGALLGITNIVGSSDVSKFVDGGDERQPPIGLLVSGGTSSGGAAVAAAVAAAQHHLLIRHAHELATIKMPWYMYGGT